MKGWPPIATEDQIKEKITLVLSEKPGCSIGRAEISKALIEVQNKSMLPSRGIAPIGLIAKPSKSTITNYMTMAATQVDVSLVKTTTPKTYQRFAAKHSLRSCMSFILTVASTHFIPGSPNKHFKQNVLFNLDKGSRILLNMIEEATGTEVYPLPTHLLLSTDDTTSYVFEGKLDGNNTSWSLVSKHVNDNSTHSYYHTHRRGNRN